MRPSWIITTALVTIASVAIGSGTGASAKNNKTKHFSCALQLFQQGPLQGTPPTGISFGFVSCPAPFGNGVHFGSATVTPTSPGHGTVAVKIKNYFNRGTTRGTVAFTFVATTPTDLTYTGTVTYTGGTGRFKRVKGSGPIVCTSSDGGAHKACKVKLTLKGI
ncbi:MAG: hypothetical protein QOG15_2399 [Solirubrobacteraceae bacterium]|jgi:hypothetical protein|nr:hypothetical protein [Solirubrobacteraceae bacterium]